MSPDSAERLLALTTAARRACDVDATAFVREGDIPAAHEAQSKAVAFSQVELWILRLMRGEAPE